MAVGRFFKEMARSFYNGGRYFTDSITRRMDPVKGLRIARVVDAVGGGVLTYFGAMGLVGNTLAVVGVASAIAASAISIPAAAGALAVSAVFGTLNALSTVFGLGLLSAAGHKIGLPSPRRAAGRVSHDIQRPFKWTGRVLAAPFKRAHDGKGKKPTNAPRPAARPKMSHKL